MEIGFVGLPNVGKSTLFNAITAGSAAASNFPFCTIDPNVGMAELSDHRLDRLLDIFSSQKIVPAFVKFVDIAGLVKDAHKGEGLGNQFLSHIRQTDAICQVVRCFDDPEVVHTQGEVDPIRDADLIEYELILADLDTISKRIHKTDKAARGDSKLKPELEFLKKVESVLADGKPARDIEVEEDMYPLYMDLFLLSAKPMIYAANVSEDSLPDGGEWISKLKERGETVVVSAAVECEIAQLDLEERDEFLESLGLKESGLDRLIHAANRLLGMQTFLTAGEKEVRAWPYKKGFTAPQCAGVIHTDFERGFIRAEIVSYAELETFGSWNAAKEAGKVRSEGKEYVMQDGDVVIYRFNV